MARTTRKVKQKLDFDDEDAVLAEMAEVLGEDRLTIHVNQGYNGPTVYTVAVGRSGTGKEWDVAEDDEAADALAISMVTEMLENEPENFTQSWLEGFINKDRLANDLRSDVESERADYYGDMSDEEFWQAAERYDMQAPEPDEDGDVRGPTPQELDTLAEKATEELLQDPMQYLEEIYSRDEAVAKAIEIAGIDVNAAAEDAVATDGAGHFLSSWDGETHETPSGLIYWRTN